MVELKLYEVVPGMNSRGQMGRIVICPTIPKRLESRETGKFYVCCKRVFLTPASFENHKKIDCKQTVENVNVPGGISLHDTIRHEANEIKRNTDAENTCTVVDLTALNVNEDSKNGSGAFICRKCHYKCSDLQRFEWHVKAAHREDLEQGKTIIKVDDVAELGDNDKKTSRVHKCEICNNYKTTYKCNLVLHKKKAHVKNGEYPCTYCTCIYETQVGLSLHLHREHSSKMKKGLAVKEKEEASSENTGDQSLPNTSAFVTDWISSVVELHSPKPTDISEHDDSSKPISVFKCSVCSKVFKKKYQLTRHQNQEHSNKSPQKLKELLRIKTAANSVWGNSSFSSHNNFQTPVKRRGYEIITDSNMSTPSKRRKISVSSEKSMDLDFQCDLCGFIAKKSLDLDLHRTVAHAVFGVECECGCSFATATELTNHKNNECVKHRVDDLQTTISTNLSLADQESRPQKYKCDCGNSFGSRRKLSKHQGSGMCQNSVKNEEIVLLQVGESSLSAVHKDSYARAAQRGKENEQKLKSPQPDLDMHRIQCPKCDTFLKNEMGLRVHLHAMHNEDMYDKCEICQYRTRNFHSYRKHKKACHVKDGIGCPIDKCLYSLKTIDSLASHCQKTHKVLLDRTLVEIKCDQCDFIAYKSRELEKHRLKGHNEEKKIRMKTEMLNCEQCGFTASNQSYLDNHIKINHVENGVKCELCNYTFHSEVGLRIHNRMMHDEDDSTDFSICKLCNYKTGTRKVYKEHYKRCHVGQVKCPECVCTFMDIDGMSRHAYLLHSKRIDKSSYLQKCSYPNCVFSTYVTANLKQHEATHSSTTPEKVGGTNKLVTCDICDAKISSLTDHLSRAHVKDGFNCPENCKCSFSTELGLSRHIFLKHGKKMETKKEVRNPLLHPVKCSECDFRSKDENSLNRHCSVMHGFTIELPKIKAKRVCDICHAQTTETLKAHKQRYHVPNGFKCLLLGCPCSFETSHSRARHMLKAHQINQTKRCHICKLKYLGTIDIHIKRCHVENGLKCEYEGCTCSFESELGRQTHMRMRHNQTVNKTCNLCGYFISVKLSEHLARNHVLNGLPCSFCSCSFGSEQGRTQHVKFRHNITVSVNCTLCGVKPVVSMNAHMKQSHVVGGLPCSHCGCAFKTERIRSRHLARYHNIIAHPTPKRCPECKMVIRIRMSEHFKNHHVPNGVRCRYCCWTFRNERGQIVHTLKQHKHQVLNDSSKTFKQTLPGMEILSESIKKQMDLDKSSISFKKLNFNSSLARSWNMLRLHQKKAKKNSKPKVNGMNNAPKGKIKPMHTLTNKCSIETGFESSMLYPCAHCSCKFSSIKGRNTHCELIHSNQKYVNDPAVQPRKENAKTQADSNKSQIVTESSFDKEKLICPNCGYAATCKSHLNIHMQKSHVKNSPFTCKLCSCAYASQEELARHEQIFHSKQRQQL